MSRHALHATQDYSLVRKTDVTAVPKQTRGRFATVIRTTMDTDSAHNTNTSSSTHLSTCNTVSTPSTALLRRSPDGDSRSLPVLLLLRKLWPLGCPRELASTHLFIYSPFCYKLYVDTPTGSQQANSSNGAYVRDRVTSTCPTQKADLRTQTNQLHGQHPAVTSRMLPGAAFSRLLELHQHQALFAKPRSFPSRKCMTASGQRGKWGGRSGSERSRQ
ncbi:hypothetical protein GQ43DRAFT_301007 [Delitschia confertaspora ATCC 74209]|uniref:Uncharacterized protein n=1 Tax=Delitschia confertaspora ATCC 74209 TaxID=1513339 RepID=A0A9P4MZT1_9PLEO|nr:hypothetical protein GQ43DRAFT_301007 [Delitschia confertaspora ATCC 74209]